MDSDKDKMNGPVCRFGPGGDFVSVWPRQPLELTHSSTGRLCKLLASMAEIVTVLLDSEFARDSAVPTRIHRPPDQILHPKEKLEYAEAFKRTDAIPRRLPN